jgi:hypothetical protein
MIAKTRCGAQACANATKHSAMLASLSLVLAAGLMGPAAVAQGPAANGFRLAQATPEFGVVRGRWVRPDGGYTIVIKGVDPSGRMDATYTNPNPINVLKAEVSREGGALRVFLELRGAGYPGSTYTPHIRAQKRQPYRSLLSGGHAAEVRRGLSKSKVAAGRQFSCALLRPRSRHPTRPRNP